MEGSSVSVVGLIKRLLPRKANKSREEEESFPLLRNGFEVTRDKDPNIAEQWVNIMNYSGENQREV